MVLVSCEVMLLGFCYTWHLNESYTFDLTLGRGGWIFHACIQKSCMDDLETPPLASRCPSLGPSSYWVISQFTKEELYMGRKASFPRDLGGNLKDPLLRQSHAS